MVQVASFYLYSFGYNIFLKMTGKNLLIRVPPSPLHAWAIISNRGPTFLNEHWFFLFFGVIFFLNILNSAFNGASRIILSLFIWLQYFFENDG